MQTYYEKHTLSCTATTAIRQPFIWCRFENMFERSQTNAVVPEFILWWTLSSGVF